MVAGVVSAVPYAFASHGCSTLTPTTSLPKCSISISIVCRALWTGMRPSWAWFDVFLSKNLNTMRHTKLAGHSCKAWVVEPLMTAGNMEQQPLNVQTIILSASILVATTASLYFGLKGDPLPCTKCGGNGGTKCVFCTDGKMKTEAGLTECRVCKGAGLLLCKNCKGSGYTRRL
ncbi:hypothetical protein O6H91_07G002400 [Diphasiastrum complanatum]|uniref:Uncharacterized protein n=1 Tax=Diphasiastrum complanatum TaxID=34168 RepID=A0ACC2D1Q2_DIPCM|nr:hypothetical protein O6H91_07G002400 [Diphasiastrum complanatum]